MEIQKLLPIGSVVRLKGAKKRLMIVGIKVVMENGLQNDYIAVTYPEGYINRDIYFKFNHEDIEEILFEGYCTEEREEFLASVQALLEQQEKEKQKV